MGTLSLAEARDYLNNPTTLSRGVDYLGSDAEYHYFEHKLEAARNVRFRISHAEGVYLPHETMPYHSCFPERRDAYKTIKGLHLIIHPDFTCQVEGRTYPGPAEVPAELWQKVGTVLFTEKRLNAAKQQEERLAPYLKNTPAVLFTYPISGLPANLLPHNQADSGPPERSGSISSNAMDELMQKKNRLCFPI